MFCFLFGKSYSGVGRILENLRKGSKIGIIEYRGKNESEGDVLDFFGFYFIMTSILLNNAIFMGRKF